MLLMMIVMALMEGRAPEEVRTARILVRATRACWWVARHADDALCAALMTGMTLLCAVALVVVVACPSRVR